MHLADSKAAEVAAEMEAMKQGLSGLGSEVTPSRSENKLLPKMKLKHQRQRQSISTDWQQVVHSSVKILQKETPKLDERQRELEHRQLSVEQQQRCQESKQKDLSKLDARNFGVDSSHL